MSNTSAAFVASPERHRTRSGSNLHKAVIKLTTYGVAVVLAVLLLTAALPPLVADQSDRAILNAPVTLLTTPIAGEVSMIGMRHGQSAKAADLVAEVQNTRVDETTLMTLSSKVEELREKYTSASRKRASDLQYLAKLDGELAADKNALETQFSEQVAALQGKLGSAQADVETKQALHDRQVQLLSRDVVSPDLLKPGTHELGSAGALRASASAQLAAAKAQLLAIRNNVYVGDNLITIATLAQKRRDVQFDADREAIEEAASKTALDRMAALLDQEQLRVKSLRDTKLAAPAQRELLQVGVAQGRHVNAGDALATLVDCRSLFAVAIFSYRQAADLAVGTRMLVTGSGLSGPIEGTVEDIIPKSNDKTDELYAVAFPQTERREMYVVVRPDAAAIQQMRNARGACPVGKWVTVSRADGWVPSSSVIWHTAASVVARSFAGLWPRAEAHAAPKAQAR